MSGIGGQSVLLQGTLNLNVKSKFVNEQSKDKREYKRKKKEEEKEINNNDYKEQLAELCDLGRRDDDHQ